MPKTALIAIGGNSLITDNTTPDVPHQWDAVRETCRHLADMIEHPDFSDGTRIGDFSRGCDCSRHLSSMRAALSECSL